LSIHGGALDDWPRCLAKSSKHHDFVALARQVMCPGGPRSFALRRMLGRFGRITPNPPTNKFDNLFAFERGSFSCGALGSNHFQARRAPCSCRSGRSSAPLPGSSSSTVGVGRRGEIENALKVGEEHLGHATLLHRGRWKASPHGAVLPGTLIRLVVAAIDGDGDLLDPHSPGGRQRRAVCSAPETTTRLQQDQPAACWAPAAARPRGWAVGARHGPGLHDASMPAVLVPLASKRSTRDRHLGQQLSGGWERGRFGAIATGQSPLLRQKPPGASRIVIMAGTFRQLPFSQRR